MNINEKFLNFITENKLINKNDRILVAFSGGKDSVFLSHLLLKNNFNIALAHLNHNLRGKESLRDMNFCIEFAQENDLQIFTRSINIKELAKIRKESIEQTGRYERYKFLNEIAKDYNFNKIATAHHFNDQIETFFINFFRKKNLFSLKGIKLKDGKIIRPILCFKKEEIEKYIDENKLKFVEDSTNFDTNFLRNKIRHSLIPFLEKGFELNLFSIIDFYQKKIIELEEIINFIINKIFKNSIVFSNDGYILKLKNLDEFWSFKFIRFEIYKNILLDLKIDYSQNLLNEIDKLIQSKEKTGKLFIHKLRVFKEYDEILFSKKDFNKVYEKELIITKPGEYFFYDTKILIEEVSRNNINLSKKTNEEFVDYEKIKFPLKVRFFKEGDRFIPLGMDTYVKLKDFFINQKIPFRIRRNIFIFEDAENEIINVGNIRISEKVKIDNNTKKALKFKILLN